VKPKGGRSIKYSKNRMKKFFIIALLLLPSTLLGANNLLKNKTVVGCENEEGYPPFIFKNTVSGKFEGYSVDLLNLVFKDSGAEMEYKLLPWKRCMAYMGKGEGMDIVLAAVSTAERRRKYQ
jgi:ABC-type amino acid transport substrate-binding protein